MTKQEQIEQLAKDIRSMNTINELQASTIYTPSYQEALCLYELGYRKYYKVLKEFCGKLKSVLVATTFLPTESGKSLCQT